VHGGIGVLHEFGADRWLREAMILAIWEGTSHRQMLDGLEVMECKQSHELLLQHLAPLVSQSALSDMRSKIEQVLALSSDERQVAAEALFRELAPFTGEALSRKSSGKEEAVGGS
jgi:acyl-CoA dehydrogenase